MKTRKIIFWIFLLIVIDQTIKIIINSFFLEVHFEIIPSLFEFKPVFNDKHSYGNVLLNKHFNINMGLWFHIIIFLCVQIFMLVLYRYFRGNISDNKKLLDVVIIFQIAGLICALIGNLIWEKGTLDYIYLKPLFIFDLKDLFMNCFIILFLVYMSKNKSQIKNLKIENLIAYTRDSLKKQLKIIP